MSTFIKIVVRFISVAALLLVALSAPLYKFGIIDLGTAFMGFKYGVYTAIAALLLLLLQGILQFAFKQKTVTLAHAAIVMVCSSIAIAVPLSMLSKGGSVPPIHDISTDLVHPPEFVVIAPLRANAPNPAAYAGAVTAEQQRNAYPDIKTQRYTQSTAALMAAITQAANNLGWEMVNTDTAGGLVEATATTTWFGFKDDVVIRVQDKGGERLVDIRSKSRVGTSDLGKNAERIRSFIKELNAVLAE